MLRGRQGLRLISSLVAWTSSRIWGNQGPPFADDRTLHVENPKKLPQNNY